jgi:hypothetical protein
MNKLNRGFSQLRDDELDNKTQSIIVALTGNAAFPTPNPTLATVQGKLDAYRTALAGHGPARAQQVVETRADLENMLQTLAVNLELTPNVTDAQLASSGFELRKPAVRSDAPVDAPENVRLKATGVNSGVQVLCDSVTRAKSYQVQTSLDPEPGTGWTDAGTFPNTRGIILTGLQRGKDIWARIRAIGPNGPGPWSDPATTMVT